LFAYALFGVWLKNNLSQLSGVPLIVIEALTKVFDTDILIVLWPERLSMLKIVNDFPFGSVQLLVGVRVSELYSTGLLYVVL
jgi:hypothetical protein